MEKIIRQLTESASGQEETMSTRKLALLIFAVALLAEPSFAQQKGDSSPCMAEYENHNQIDYGP